MSQSSPFKFLDSYTKDDKHIFFGREREIDEIYTHVFESKLLLVYGASGTGKSSLISCGLANKFNDADWLPISIRRGLNINETIQAQIKKAAITKIKPSKKESNRLIKPLRSVYLDHFKPIHLIFDQFEELFIFGTPDELSHFIEDIRSVLDSDLNIKFIFVIRGEYLEHLAEFEETIPDFFNNRIRIEKMTRANALHCINGPCEYSGIKIEPHFAENLLMKLSPEKAEIELTYLQIFLDRIYKSALDFNGTDNLVFTNKSLEELGNIGDVLSEFLDEQIENTKDKELTMVVLKSFVTSLGTKRQVSLVEIQDFTKVLGGNYSIDQIENVINELVNSRIIKDKDESDRYELRHDSIAAKINQKITQYERDLIEVRQFLDYSFQEHRKRDFLLNESDLAYVLPFQERLNLPQEIEDFIKKSKKVEARKKRGRKQLYSVVALIVFLLLASVGFLLYAIDQKKEADKNAELAVQQSETARLAQISAEEQSQLANAQRLLADSSAAIAAQEAQRAKFESERATSQQLLADRARSEAEKQRLLAQESARIAKEQAKEANNQKERALAAEIAEQRLRILSIAQSMATKSLQVRDKQLKILLALQAFNFHSQFGGYAYQNDIYNGLYFARKSHSVIDSSSVHLHKGPIKNIIPYQDMLITSGSDGRMLKSDNIALTRGNIKSIKIPSTNKETIHTMALSNDQNILAIGTDGGKIQLYNSDTNELIKTIEAHNGGVWVIDFLPDNKHIISTGNHGNLKVWDIENDTNSNTANESQINAIKVKNQNEIFIGFEDGSVSLLKNGVLQNWIKPQGFGAVNKININKKEEILVVGYANGTIVLTSLNTNNILNSLTVHQGAVTDIQFHQDLPLMLTSSMDRSARLWNLRALNEIPVELSDYDDWVFSVSFTLDGSGFVTGDGLGNLTFYPLQMDALTEGLCDNINRNFTLDEWKNYVGDIDYQNTCVIISSEK